LGTGLLPRDILPPYDTIVFWFFIMVTQIGHVHMRNSVVWSEVMQPSIC
jgi:hypothetical protein